MYVTLHAVTPRTALPARAAEGDVVYFPSCKFSAALCVSACLRVSVYAGVCFSRHFTHPLCKAPPNGGIQLAYFCWMLVGRAEVNKTKQNMHTRRVISRSVLIITIITVIILIFITIMFISNPKHVVPTSHR